MSCGLCGGAKGFTAVILMRAQRSEDLLFPPFCSSVELVKTVESVFQKSSSLIRGNRRSGRHEELWNNGFDRWDGFYGYCTAFHGGNTA